MKNSDQNNIEFFNGKLNQNAPYHKTIPFIRSVLANSEIFTNCNVHIAVHSIKNIDSHKSKYCKVHSHDVDEINLIIGNNDGKGLKYKITNGDEDFFVDSPQSVFIPKNTKHSAEAIEGEGYFICIVMKGNI